MFGSLGSFVFPDPSQTGDEASGPLDPFGMGESMDRAARRVLQAFRDHAANIPQGPFTQLAFPCHLAVVVD